MKKILLSLVSILTISASSQDCSELFISEYVEGYGQNKAIEVYNPTSNTIDLSNYKVERYANGATNSSAGGITTLSGMIASGDAFVLTNGETDTSSPFGYCDPLLISLGDMAEPNGSYPTPMHMNGNDAIVLTKNGNIIDVIGRVGEDPGICWTDNAASGYVSGSQAPFNPGTWYTTGHTLTRKAVVKVGDGNGLDLFNPSLEWDTLPVGSWNNLGMHICDCIGTTDINETKEVSYVMYPNPANLGDQIIINSSAKITEITVINIIGKQKLSLYTNTIPTSGLSPGTYLINIKFFDGREVENKLIVE